MDGMENDQVDGVEPLEGNSSSSVKCGREFSLINVNTVKIAIKFNHKKSGGICNTKQSPIC